LLEPSRLPVALSIPKARAEHCCLQCVKGMFSIRAQQRHWGANAYSVALVMQFGGTYEVGLSWVTSSANQPSSSDRWLGVISVKARPIPNLRSQ
jgi:hypothetical protein